MCPIRQFPTGMNILGFEDVTGKGPMLSILPDATVSLGAAFKRAALIFLPIAATLSLIIVAAIGVDGRVRRDMMEVREKSRVELASEEITRDFNEVGTDLRVIAMRNWSRGDWYDSTGIPWVDPSPNMRSLNAALLYPGVAMLEYSRNYSVGRGTDAPFEQVGAEFIRGPELAAYLESVQVIYQQAAD